MTETEPDTCAALIHPGSYYEPPTYCEDDAAPDSDYCPRHRWADDDADDDDLPDDIPDHWDTP